MNKGEKIDMLEQLRITLRGRLSKSKTTARILIAIFCFAVAAVSALAMSQVLQAQGTLVEVVKPSVHIAAGTQIQAGDVVLVQVGEYGLPGNVATGKIQVVGQYAKTDLYPEDTITLGKLSPRREDPFLGDLAGKKIMSFTVPNLAASVAGNIRTGDIIQIIYSNEGQGVEGRAREIETIMPEALQNLMVVDIKDADGYNREQTESGDVSGLYGTDAYIPSVITVYVNDLQAAELHKAERSKSIHVIFIRRGDETW
jgi:hypothetical protein